MHLDAVGTGPLDFASTMGSIQSGISADFTLPASTGNKFYNYVFKYNPFSLQWKYKINGDSEYWMNINSSSHVVYLTYTSPIYYQTAEPTKKRMNWCVTTASLESAIHNIASKIQNGLGGDPPYEPTDPGATGSQPSPEWIMMDGPDGSHKHGAECLYQARMMKAALGQLGISAVEERVFASYDTNTTYQDTRTCPTHGYETLWYYAANGWNNYEGACKVADSSLDGYKWYAVWPVLTKNTAVGILRGVAQYQRWGYVSGSTWVYPDDPNHNVSLPNEPPD